MNNNKTPVQKYVAPVVILIIILLLWEGMVSAFQIQQFLLPRPSVIASNFARVVVLDPEVSVAEPDDAAALLRQNQLLVRAPADLPAEAATALAEIEIWRLGNWVLVWGNNITPIYQASLFTLRGALGGFALGCSLGILTAFATSRWTVTREALMPFAIAANSTPIIAFAPVMNNWFGITNPFSKMAVVAVMTFFPMMINTVRGLTQVDKRSLELMQSYAASPFEILWKLRVPNALPYMFNGFKVAAALSMIGAIVGEYFGGPRISLGVFITQEAALFRFGSAWAAIIAACLIGIAIYLIVIGVERFVMPWHASFRD